MSRGYVKPDEPRAVDDPPEGFRRVSIPDDRWRVLPESAPEYLCRRMSGGPDYTYCQNRAVAQIERGRRGRWHWWAYCADHLYGRWIEDGVVMSWRLEREA